MLSVNVEGDWVQVKPSVNRGGDWVEPRRVWVKRGNVWALVWPESADLQASAAGTGWDTARVSWTFTGPDPVDGFDVLRGGVLVAAGVTGTVFDDSGLLPATTYVYTVRAMLAGTVVARASAAAVTSPRTPMTVQVSAPRWDRVAVSWTDPAGGATSYRVRLGTVVAWQGTGTSTTLELLNPATAYSVTVEALRGTDVVGSAAGSATTPAYPAVGLSATPVSQSQINVAWQPLDGSADRVTLLRSTGQTLYQGTGVGYADAGRVSGTRYDYRLNVERAGAVLAAGTAAATTPLPPQTTVTVTLNPSSSGSYQGTGARRTDTSNYYAGQYDSTRGLQKSAWAFSIPPNLRNCIRVDRVEFSVRNLHSYNNGGVTQHIALTHTQTAGGTWPGSTAAFAPRATAKGGWWGNGQWQDITNEAVPTTGGTVASNFRINAWGVCLVAPSTAIGYYSYWTTAQLRVTYTHAT